MSRTVFFSWQSDRSPREGRNLIEKALEMAVARIANDVTVEEAVREGLKVDKDTKGVPGSPPIFDTILAKIDKASIFIADLTMCGTRCTGKPTPNPNVLIEYGWAFKSLGYHQLITVMNEAHGEPGPESMPFDLAHIRFPITYNLPDDAPDAKRREVREQLAKTLESALREVFESEQFRAKLPKEPEPLPFRQRTPMNGRARFRPADEPLGVIDESQDAKALYLSDGPAMWLRLMPSVDPRREWLTQDLKNPILKLAILPLMRGTANSGFGSIGFVRSQDGCGRYPIWDYETTIAVTYSVAYVFTTGEIWIINAWLGLAKIARDFLLEEFSFTKTLDECALFLDSFSCTRPYRWVVGMEGMLGRRLNFIDNGIHRTFGRCTAEVIEEEGIYQKGDSAGELLRPFFEKVFDQCGERRPPAA